jgi:hypothetical protein
VTGFGRRCRRPAGRKHEQNERSKMHPW